ncbi:MAG: R3H domain-containing nucleic acid-binding protein [Patescibacteria group bacterium]
MQDCAAAISNGMKEDIQNKIQEIVQNLLDKVGFDGTVRLTEGVLGKDGSDLIENKKEGFMVVSIESDKDLSVLIGKNGQNLIAFDHIAHLLVNRGINSDVSKLPVNFIVDINDYRKSRANYLVDIAHNVAKRVIQTQKAEALLPMNAYERRLVHTELASFKELQTESIGQEPRRRIVVKPTLLL